MCLQVALVCGRNSGTSRARLGRSASRVWTGQFGTSRARLGPVQPRVRMSSSARPCRRFSVRVVTRESHYGWSCTTLAQPRMAVYTA